MSRWAAPSTPSTITRQTLPFQTEYVNFPTGMDIWPIEPLHGLVSLLLASMSVVAMSNVFALVNLTLNGVCGALFGRELSGDMLGGLVAGAGAAPEPSG